VAPWPLCPCWSAGSHWHGGVGREHIFLSIEVGVENQIVVVVVQVRFRKVVQREEEVVHHTVSRRAMPAQAMRMSRIVVLRTGTRSHRLLPLALPASPGPLLVFHFPPSIARWSSRSNGADITEGIANGVLGGGAFAQRNGRADRRRDGGWTCSRRVHVMQRLSLAWR
jgi:hypothetical protein